MKWIVTALVLLAGIASAQTLAEKEASYMTARSAAWQEVLTGACAEEFRAAAVADGVLTKVALKRQEAFDKCFEPHRQHCRSACGSNHTCAHECLEKPGICEDDAVVQRTEAVRKLAATAADAARVKYESCSGKKMPEVVCPAQWDDPAAKCG